MYLNGRLRNENDFINHINIANSSGLFTKSKGAYDVTLDNFVYMGDDRATDESIIEYANNLGHANNLIGDHESFTQVLVLTCTFKTGKKGNEGQPPNKTYDDWQIYLARVSPDSKWIFLTWGLG